MVDPVIASKKAVLLTCAIPEVKRGCPVSALHKSEAISLSQIFFFLCYCLPLGGGRGPSQVIFANSKWVVPAESPSSSAGSCSYSTASSAAPALFEHRPPTAEIKLPAAISSIPAHSRLSFPARDQSRPTDSTSVPLRSPSSQRAASSRINLLSAASFVRCASIRSILFSRYAFLSV